MKVFGTGNDFNQAKVDEARNKERAAPVKSDNAGKSSKSAQASETVAVSGLAREIGKIKNTAREAPEIRREKVEAIKAKIDKGEYHVSGTKIAGKIIEDIIKQDRA